MPDRGELRVPGDEMPLSTHGAYEETRPECGGEGLLDDGEKCPAWEGKGIVLRAGGG